MKNFIMNQRGHFFVTDFAVHQPSLENCKVFDSLEELYAAVCNKFDLQLDEVEDLHFEISDEGESGYWNGDFECEFSDFDAYTIEEYISRFVQ